MITLDTLNVLPVEAFTETLGAIFEHSPWVAQRAATSRPFASRLDLLDAMRAAVRDAPIEDQLTLIRAHPQLGARGRKRLELTEASSREQRRAGLDACSDEEFAELMRLNVAYVQKFDFPFILAVRGHDPESILAFMRRRLNNSLDEERHTALTQIGLIGGYRLADLVASSAAAEVLAMQARGAPDPAAARAGAYPGHIRSESGPPASPLREWMLAAGLDVRAGVGFTAPSTIGFPPSGAGANAALADAARSTSAPQTAYFLFGAYFDTTIGGLRRDGSLSILLGVAIAQTLRVKQQPLRFGLLVFPFPEDGRQGSILLNATPGALREHTALAAADIDSLAPVRAAGITERCVALLSPTPDSGANPLDLNALERSVDDLERVLTRLE